MNKTKKEEKKKLYMIIGLIVVGIVAVPSMLWQYKTMWKRSVSLVVQKPTGIPTALPAHAIDTGGGSYVLSTTNSAENKFISPKLGVSFIYTASYTDTIKVAVEEIGEKIYRYDPSGLKALRYSGQYIQVFSKDIPDDLATAIKKQLLSGISENNCYVETAPVTDKMLYFSSTNLPTLITAEIKSTLFQKYGKTNTYDTLKDNCPSQYTPINFMAYFVMDQQHPDRYFFLNAGQQPLGIKDFTIFTPTK